MTDEQLRSTRVVVDLDDEGADDRNLTGSKAAALATARRAGLPVPDGFVITTEAGQRPTAHVEVRERWSRLSRDGARPLVVRSSSTTEDLADSSMAGRYESVGHVEGWEAFVAAVDVVLESRVAAAEGVEGLTGEEDLAVLVQPMLGGPGGVLFGVDPVTGRGDRRIAVISGKGPDAVVSGEVNGSRYVLDGEGRVLDAEVDAEVDADGSRLDPAVCRSLAALASRLADVFGHPQDIEWILDDDGRIVLLQSRPVTTAIVGAPVGSVYGRGPVAETFPEPLAPLEQDLWVPPLDQALGEALVLSGAAERDEVDAAPLTRVVNGYVAIDLERTGEWAPPRSRLAVLDPRPRVRRLLAAWRVGRLRGAMPSLAEDVVEQCDESLAAVDDLRRLTDWQLLAILLRGQRALRSLHAHEILMGQLVDPTAPNITGASVAMRVLVHAREADTPEDDIPRRHPVVLALTPPRIGRAVQLPAVEQAPQWRVNGERSREAVLREALRLRVRWVQELTGRAAWELGERLAAGGLLPDAATVRRLRLAELRTAVAGGDVPGEAQHRPLPTETRHFPAQFRFSAEGGVVPVVERNDDGGGASGAGGGTGQGRVVHDRDAAKPGDVLVVRNLDASLGPVLAGLGGLVAETGSVLAHVAILAREAGVPTVVGATGAVDRYPEGTTVRVDGDSGLIEEVE